MGFRPRYQLSTVNSQLLQYLFVANLFHPLDNFAVQRFLNGDMSHCGRRRGAVPMLLVRRKPDHIAWPDLLDRSAIALRPPKSGRDDQCLPEWMSVPGSASTRLERDTRATNPRRLGCLEQRFDADVTLKPIRWPF